MRNMISPSTALTVMSWPQLELTDCVVMLLSGTCSSVPILDFAWASSSGFSDLVFTTIWLVEPEPTFCAGSALTPASANAVFTWLVVIEVFVTGIWNWVPPLNSIP